VAGGLPVWYLPGDPAVNMPADWGAWVWPAWIHRSGALLFTGALSLLFLFVGAAQALHGAFSLKSGIKLLEPFLAVGGYGWLGMEFLLRGMHFVIGLGDMGALDLVSSGLGLAASGVIPIGLSVAVARLKLFGD
jgi:hypothetical protein